MNTLLNYPGAKWGMAREIVGLMPKHRSYTKWFHDYIYGKAEIRFVRGRLKFGDARSSAPFPSMVVVFNGNMLGGSNMEVNLI